MTDHGLQELDPFHPGYLAPIPPMIRVHEIANGADCQCGELHVVTTSNVEAPDEVKCWCGWFAVASDPYLTEQSYAEHKRDDHADDRIEWHR